MARALAQATNHELKRSSSLVSQRLTVVALVLITGIALALRLHLLGTLCLTLDEADSAFFAHVSWKEFLAAIRYGEGTMTMVLFFILLRGWTHLGDSEFTLRILPLLFGVATIPAIYKLGDRFLSRNVGIAAAALLAVHSYHLRFSQQLRAYSMALFFLVLSTYFLLSAIEATERKSMWAAYVLTSVLAIYSHTFALLVLIPQWLSLTAGILRRIGFIRLLGIGLAEAVLLSPIGAQSVLCSRCKEALEWIPRPTLDGVLLATQNLAGSYTWTPNPSTIGYVFLFPYAALWMLAALGLHRFDRQSPANSEHVAVRLLMLWLVFPFAATLLFPLFNPFGHPRYLFNPSYMILCVPAAALLAGQGISVLSGLAPRERWVFPSVLLIMLALSVAGVTRYYVGLQAYNRYDDWRPVIDYVVRQQQMGDATIFPARGYRTYLYYARREIGSGKIAGAPPVAFPTNMADELANPYLTVGKVDLSTRPYQRIWMIVSLEDSYEMKQAALIRSGLAPDFHFRFDQNFPWVGMPNKSVSLFVRNPVSSSAPR